MPDSGDQIEVAAGIYGEAIDFLGKAVRVYNSGGPDVTTIDATGKDTSGVSCKSGEGSGTILEGFTITGGSGTDNPLGFGRWGGGMYNYVSRPTVTNCIFSNNQAFAGGGMSNDGCSPTVTNCTFSNNTADTGGGMFNGGADVTVTNCLFSGNLATWGGAMSNYTASPTVTNCTFSNNACPVPGSTYAGMYNEAGSFPTVTNSIFWANGGGQFVNTENSSAAVTYSDVQGGYEGMGNINADPLFVGGGDYRLQEGSPCIDTGSNSAVSVTTDLDGNPRIANNTVDMGAMNTRLPWCRLVLISSPAATRTRSTSTVMALSPWPFWAVPILRSARSMSAPSASQVWQSG